MAIDPFAIGSSATATGASGSAANSSLSQLGEDYQSFITLLTAQIQNQDPLEPMDSTAFVSQLATLTQVEQAVVQNANLEGIASQLSGLSAMSGLNFLGREVVAPMSNVTLSDGNATLGYRLGNEASDVSLAVIDGAGRVVRNISGLPGTTGTLHQVIWDGLDDEGLPLADGRYSMQLVGLDADGNTVNAQTYALSQVASLTYEQGLAMLHLETGEQVPAGMIEEVR
ncbi:basal-body rod modification protein FlgD [Salipiger pallidus]|uniref:Basal-body rod modification protein FlgD n=1 Tax=Salipiger pallidus TaxID=1775170 RepID=A0A8J3EF41_9RHOB|nr:flagellar hook assembly protein FlgD [Salipiger pallidus]GGG67635.1 basal-body rod modification protein FlgD [Salipiger pallidus]